MKDITVIFIEDEEGTNFVPFSNDPSLQAVKVRVKDYLLDNFVELVEDEDDAEESTAEAERARAKGLQALVDLYYDRWNMTVEVKKVKLL